MKSVFEYHDIANPDAIARAGLFVAEGRLVVRRLLSSRRFTTRSLLMTPTAHAAMRDVIRPDVPCFIVSQDEMNSIVGFNIHRGCLALAERPQALTVEEMPLGTMRHVIVLEGVNNPDNVGGIFRSAAAFDADMVVLGPACGDPLYRKAIRTSMAATLDVPFSRVRDWPGALHTLRGHGIRVLALTPSPDAQLLETLPRGGRVALLLGTEGAGLSQDALAASDERVRIRTSERVDSLNVAVAASIAMHHLF